MKPRIAALFGTVGALVLLAAAFAVTAPASSLTLTVCASGCQFTTVADALAAAEDGTKIDIGPGTYDGGFTVTKSVSLVGAGQRETTIKGLSIWQQTLNYTPVVEIGNAAVTLSGVTVTGGSVEAPEAASSTVEY